MNNLFKIGAVSGIMFSVTISCVQGMNQQCSDVRDKYQINTIFNYIKEIKAIEARMYPSRDPDAHPQTAAQYAETMPFNLKTSEFTLKYCSNDFVYFLRSVGVLAEKGSPLTYIVLGSGLLLCCESLTEERENELVDEFVRLLKIYDILKSPTADKTAIKENDFVKFLSNKVLNTDTLTFNRDLPLMKFFWGWADFKNQKKQPETK